MDWYERARSIPKELETSPQWHQITTQLQATPGGGPAVAALSKRALELCHRDAQTNTPASDKTRRIVEAWKEVCWEKLHSGSWREVPLVWRDAYSAACILAAFLELRNNNNRGLMEDQGHNCRAEVKGKEGICLDASIAASVAALRHLDMAALMGGTALRPLIDSLIEDIQRHICPGPSPAALAGTEEPLLSGEGEFYANINENINATATERDNQEELIRAYPEILPPGSLIGPRASHPQIESLPSLERFIGNYYGSCPVVILDAMASWPALERWRSAAYLRAVAGPRTVPVEVGRHYLAEGWGQKLMLFSEFLDNHLAKSSVNKKTVEEKGVEYIEDDDSIVYLAQHALLEQIPALAADVREPEYCALGESGVVAVNAWLGPAGTVTPAHTDPYHNLLCQVVGRKYVRLYPPTATAAMYPNEGLMDNTSQVDVDAPDTAQYPLFESTPFIDCILHPGQMLYIPPKWWHYVKSVSTSISVSYWWK